jgi:nucleotide-binding universal stress UspA family protein
MLILCYDGSDNAKHAIAQAHKALGDQPAVVLHVWNPPMQMLTPDPFGGVTVPTGPPIIELERMAVDRAADVTADGGEVARTAGFTNPQERSEPNEGSVWRTILDVADEVDATVIVMGTRGLSRVRSSLIGSVSNAIMHHSSRMVLIVPDSDE